jgi:hypothetical protein
MLSLHTFAAFAQGQPVQIVSDSRVTVRIVPSWTSRFPRTLIHMRTLRAVYETHKVTLSTRHLLLVFS